jgi:hypothetical protein
VCFKELRWLFDPNFFRDRRYDFPESVDRVLRLEDVDDAEAVPALPCKVDEQAVKRKVGQRLPMAPPVGEPPDDLLVLLLREARYLVDAMYSIRTSIAASAASIGGRGGPVTALVVAPA